MTIGSSAYKSIHPFAARMAPDLALDACSQLTPTSLVVDPMVGSGTTVYAAAKVGCTAVGIDIDPLAVLMTRVRTMRIRESRFLELSEDLVKKARNFTGSRRIAYIDSDPETKRFTDYWFANAQQHDLRALAILINGVVDVPIRHALKIALSRLIITKDKGASLARDVSHSRPHKVRIENDFDVLRQFALASKRLSAILHDTQLAGKSLTFIGDARKTSLPNSCADLIITSPPYLNAIDYLRGHRLSLIWFGYPVASIRKIRAESIGAERGVSKLPSCDMDRLRHSFGEYSSLPPRFMRIVDRYALDLCSLYAEQARLLKAGGQCVTVIGNSAVRGTFLRNDQAAITAAAMHGLHLMNQYNRELPPSRRYLPPPEHYEGAALRQRMRTESVMRFSR